MLDYALLAFVGYKCYVLYGLPDVVSAGQPAASAAAGGAQADYGGQPAGQAGYGGQPQQEGAPQEASEHAYVAPETAIESSSVGDAPLA